MAYNHEKTVEYEADGLHQQVTYVKPTATKIDEKGLRKALTAKVYDGSRDRPWRARPTVGTAVCVG
jgi:hypothetical protein